ncbi:MAG: TrmB family transcriptional regulator [Candidatus Heimdallarchaeota archaeon]
MTSGNIQKQIEPAVDAFVKLGFPRYESLILAMLSVTGTSTVKEIHQQTDIPLPKVYQTLDSLSRKKFIKHHSKSRPAKYTVYSPDILISTIQQENRSAEETLRAQLVDLKESSTPTFAGDISPFVDMDDLLRIGRGIIKNENSRISAAMSTKTLALFNDELEAAKNRGVKLRSLTISQIQRVTSSMDPADYIELGFEHFVLDVPTKVKPSLDFIKLLKKLGDAIDYLGILISDHGETLIILPLFPNDRYFGIWIYNKGIINRQLYYYNDLFKLAKKT